VIEIGNRRRDLPPPPWVVFEALTQPHRDPTRPWLILLDDEAEPTVVAASEPELVIWSTLWPHRPTIQIRFEMEPDSGTGTKLRWRLLAEQPIDDESAIGHMRKRINELINANLRYSFGQ
jgi:hypothetical protein